MSHPRLVAFCVFLVFGVGSGVVWSQSVEDAYSKFYLGYINEFHPTSEQHQKYYAEFETLTNQIRLEHSQTSGELLMERLNERLNALGTNADNVLGRDATREEINERIQAINDVQTEFTFDSGYDLRKKIADKEREMLPDAQQRQQRQFQLRESIMSRLASFHDPGDFLLLEKIVSPHHSSLDSTFGRPDFLELTPEQVDLIKEIQKETYMKFSHIRRKSLSEQPEKQNDLNQLVRKLNETESPEERNEIRRKIDQVLEEAIKPYIPELKAILIEGRESYMRVLTDAQKAKIEEVLADMPDYMKNLLAAIDRKGGGLSILHNWQPGMGVPGVNPNREAPRERSNTGGRAFPGN